MKGEPSASLSLHAKSHQTQPVIVHHPAKPSITAKPQAVPRQQQPIQPLMALRFPPPPIFDNSGLQPLPVSNFRLAGAVPNFSSVFTGSARQQRKSTIVEDPEQLARKAKRLVILRYQEKDNEEATAANDQRLVNDIVLNSGLPGDIVVNIHRHTG
jgi:hypothetical protein